MAESGPWEDYQEVAERPPWLDYSPSSGGFDKAVQRLLKTEGGFVNDPDDRGGATKFGISQRSYPNLDISKLTEDDARAIYREDYWNALGADQLPEDVRESAFDAAVNQGIGWTRRALRETGNNLQAFNDRRKQRYDAIVARDPSQRKFYNGWMNRLNSYAPSGPWEDYRGK